LSADEVALKVALIIPTYNAERYIDNLFAGIAMQTLQPNEILIIDSSSKDKTQEKLAHYPCKIHVIAQKDFDHGGTRQLGTELIEADIYIYLTQDAIPADKHSFENLVQAFLNPKVGCAYGRQLPHKNATFLAAHARHFLYPEQSVLKSYENRHQFGIKACFNSDSFSAYRKQALIEAGGFPNKLIVSEDAYVAGKMLLKDWHVAYQAQALVYHSHNYSILQEAKRYFDIGVFHSKEQWIIKEFHTPTRIGMRFVRSELRCVFAKRALYIAPLAIIKSGAKYIGYRLGTYHARLPNWLRSKLSAHPGFWQNNKTADKFTLLLYSINYGPELTGIGKYNTEMCEWLAKRNHKVKVITAQPYYPNWQVFPGYKAWRFSKEHINGVEVLRCPLWVPSKPTGIKRALHLLSFAASSSLRLLAQLRCKPNILLFIEPSIFCFPGALLASKVLKAKPVLHVQDFEVDMAFNLKLVKAAFIEKWLIKFEQASFKRCSIVSTITPNMRQKLLKKGVPEEKAILFPNWADTENIKPLACSSPFRTELGIQSDKVVALYSGNMGEKQGLDIIINAAKQLSHCSNIIFVMCGAGSYAKTLQKLASSYNLLNIIWLPLQPIDKLNDLLNLADIHLLPQKPDVQDQVMPSKLLGMMASGKAILATAFSNTQLHAVVGEVGLVSAPGSNEAFVKNIAMLSEDKALRETLGKKARLYAELNFSKEAVLSKYELALKQIII